MDVLSNSKDVQQLTEKIRIDIITQVSDEILLDNIREQIRNVKNNPEMVKHEINFIEIFMTRLNSASELYPEDEIIQNKVRNIKQEFFGIVLMELQDIFKFNIEFRDNFLLDEQIQIVSELYVFFITRLKENITNYGKNMIANSISNYISKYKNLVDKKDPLFIALKKLHGMDNSLIFFYINDIINSITVENLPDFIEVSIKGEEAEFTNTIINNIFLMPDTYVDLGLEFGGVEIINDIIQNDSEVRQLIENSIRELLK